MKKNPNKLTSRQKEFLDELEESVLEAGRIHRGEKEPSRRFVFPEPDVKKIRASLGKSQSAFAAMVGVSIGTLRGWEQRRRRPTGPAMALLRVAERSPKVVEAALRPPREKLSV
jgi:putative transcriptional regulator